MAELASFGGAEPPQEAVIEEPPKRGRGRPKGSLNKRTIATREAEASAAAEMRASIGAPPQKLTLDVSFDDDEIPQAPREPPKPPKKKVREPLPEPEPEPEPEPREDADDDETVRPEYQIGSGSDDTEPEPPPPSPRRRAKRQPKPKAPKPVRMTEPEPPSYLEVLKRGLDIAKHKQKAEKIERYDSFFRY
jgi:hypothetical protein